MIDKYKRFREKYYIIFSNLSGYGCVSFSVNSCGYEPMYFHADKSKMILLIFGYGVEIRLRK